MWDLLLMIVPHLLKIVIWNVEKRITVEANFREWVRRQQSKAPLYVEIKESYDEQVEELNKEESTDGKQNESGN